MSHTLHVDIRDNVYQALARKAQEAGCSPESLAAQWLEKAVEPSTEDPLEDVIGAFDSAHPDWADEHDMYLGKAVEEKMNAGDSNTRSDA